MTTAITLTPTKLKIRVPYVATQNPYGDAEEMHFDLQEQLKDDTDDRYTIKTKITKKHYIYTFTTVKKEHGKTTVDMQDAFYLVEFFQRKQIADAGDVLKTVYKGNKLVVTLKSNAEETKEKDENECILRMKPKEEDDLDFEFGDHICYLLRSEFDRRRKISDKEFAEFASKHDKQIQKAVDKMKTLFDTSEILDDDVLGINEVQDIFKSYKKFIKNMRK